MAKKPTGVSISKNGTTFTVSWKRAQDYSGQQCQYATSHQSWKSVGSIGKTATSKSITIGSTTYVAFRVRGKKSGKWSDWKEAWFWLAIPYTPSVSYSVASEKTTFSWNQRADSSIAQDFQYLEYQTAFTNASNRPSWSASAISKSTEASVSYTEDSVTLASGSHSRWFRIRAVGLAGATDWVTLRRVYATPNPAIITQAKSTEDTAGINGYVAWTTSSSAEYPIDSTTVQYLIITPAANVSLPSGSLSWNNIGGYASTKGKDAISFETGTTLEEDEVMFVRVNTQHDDRINYGAAQVLKIGYLAEPSNVSLTDIDITQFRVTVNATNESDVPDSFLVVTYKTKTEEIDLAVIPHGQSSVVVQCPDWTEDQNVSFGVRSVVGTATLTQTRPDGVKIYKVDSKMQSKNIIWQGGTLPVTPANVEVSATSVKGSVEVTWDWTWSQARYADVSWSDHEDAWESTNEPSSYRVSTVHAPRWYIAGLEAGKTWYVRVRLVADDGETVSPWSPVESIDLSSVPAIPALTLSASVITLEDILSAYWSYATADGKAQAYAEICEATITNGVISYGNIIAHTETAQHVDINPKDLGWATGEIHYLCVRVVSGSGKSSDGWSAPVPVTVAEPLECEITDTSLEYTYQEENPVTRTGDFISFETDENFVPVVANLFVDLEPIQDGTPWMSDTFETEPYNYRRTADGEIEHSFNSEYDEIVGASVGWNQLVPTSKKSKTITPSGIATYSYDADASLSPIPNHIYFVSADITYNGSKFPMRTYTLFGGKYGSPAIDITSNAKKKCEWIVKAENTNGIQFGISNITTSDKLTSADEWSRDNTMYIDLTLALGSTIADYVLSLETTTAGSGVTWLKTHFPRLFDNGYMSFDSGSIKSVSGLTAHEMVGVNQWDGTYEANKWLNDTNGTVASQSGYNLTDFIKVVPNTVYYKAVSGSGRALFYDSDKNALPSQAWNTISSSATTFTAPSDAHYIRFVITPANISGFILNISDASKNGTYEPYTEHTYPLDSSVELRGRYYLDSNNQLRTDGDVWKSNGQISREWDLVDLGTINWTYDSTNQRFYGGVPGISANQPFLCARYKYVGSFTDLVDKSCCNIYNTQIGIKDSAYTDSASFKASLNGVYLRYKKATPTTESATPYDSPQWCDSHGTEEYVGSELPVGHNTRYADIYPISGWTEVTATRTGKNLIDGSTKEATSQTVARWHYQSPIKLEAGKTYTLSSDNASGTVYFMDALTDTMLVSGSSSKTYTPQTDTLCYFRVYLPSGISGVNAQLELGSTATAYEPYQVNSYTTDLDRTVYGGTLDMVSGVLTVDRGIKTFNGSEVWAKHGSVNNAFYSNNAFSDAKASSSDALANWLVNGTTALTQLSLGQFIIDTSGKRLALRTDVVDTAEEFIQFLSANNLIICYKLATPQTYQLTPQQINLLLGNNNVWSNDGSITLHIVDVIREYYALKEMPFTVTVTGAGNGGITMVAVERAEDYRMDRPDENDVDGHKGETIALMYSSGEEQVSIDVENLKGRLDDGAKYNLIALIKDNLGQTSEARIDSFEVHWTHQASIPSVTVVADQTNLIAQITPIAPENATADDVADIYRLSIDKPQLIVEGATFGTTYVDPYPALGEMGGYRVVTRTKNGDYITEDNMLAWVDVPVGIENNDLLNIINFEGRQILFYWDTDYSHSWTKDFEETQYLGGSVQGDWNSAVSRVGTLSGRAITVLDQEMLKDVRRLAVYPGICHIRTADGSSYSGDVQVSEDRVHDEQEMVVNYSLSITRVDDEGLDGMTLEQYQAGGDE